MTVDELMTLLDTARGLNAGDVQVGLGSEVYDIDDIVVGLNTGDVVIQLKTKKL